MTIITTTTALDTQCNLSSVDSTGFYNSSTNPTGFLTESDSSALALNLYKISNGYFLNILLLDKYASTPIITNPTEGLINIPTGSVNATYATNFPASTYPLIYDGTYTIKRFFIPSLAFYNANSANSIYNGITMYYSDGVSIYIIVNSIGTILVPSVATPTIVTPLVFATSDLSSSNVLSSNTQFISTCNMNNCYFRLLSTILEYNIGKRTHRHDYTDEYESNYGDSYLDSYKNSKSEDDRRYILKDLIGKRDILYMTFEAIKYLTSVNNITQIQKLIESIDVCGTLCGEVLSQAYNCGCNG
jgi:hypothetical protein